MVQPLDFVRRCDKATTRVLGTLPQPPLDAVTAEVALPNSEVRHLGWVSVGLSWVRLIYSVAAI
jgi:hypothetical protein